MKVFSSSFSNARLSGLRVDLVYLPFRRVIRNEGYPSSLEVGALDVLFQHLTVRSLVDEAIRYVEACVL